MSEPLKGKTAIVTGASSGIGAAIAKELAASGANVVLAARNEQKLQQIATEIDKSDHTLCVTADMTNKEDVTALKDEANQIFGHVDIYVNNAGIMSSGAIVEGEVSDWEQMIDINVKGVLYGIHSVLPDMLEKSGGHIVNIASDSGLEVLERGTVYSATKYAVRAISMGLEKELAKTGVRVSNISPGMVETPLSSESPFDPRGKMLEPTDIARAVVFAVTQPDYVDVNEITVRTVWE